MNAGRAFFDTNILLYMHSHANVQKQQRAQELFAEFAQSGRLLLSTQVVQEFYAAGSRKLALPPDELKEIVSSLLDLPMIVVEGSEILRAIENTSRYGVSFWDGLILAAAETGEAQTLFTEDLNDGQRYGSVTARNPFQFSHSAH